jgi:hypothetical protein
MLFAQLPTDVMLREPGWTVPFNTRAEKLEALVYINRLRQTRRAAPTGLGMYLSLCKDAELRAFFADIQEAVRPGGMWDSPGGRFKASMAADLLVFFHQVKCDNPGTCLAKEVDDFMEDLAF